MTASEKIKSILKKVDPVNAEQLIDEFSKAHIQDVLLPFPESGIGLPSHLRRDRAKLKRFNEAQNQMIESTADCLDEALKTEDGYKQHFHLSRHVILQHYFDISPDTEVSLWNEETCKKDLLGHGGFARVFKVPRRHEPETDIRQEGFVAMKYLIRPRQPPENSGDNLPWYWRGMTHIGESLDGERYEYPSRYQRYFQKEVNILRRIREISDPEAKWQKLKDNHIVKIKASFTDPDGFGIMLSPVASFSLEDMLGKLSKERRRTSDATQWRDSSDTEPQEASLSENQLLGFIGCLASSVRFLHKNNIRHKDLKTGNVLVYRSEDADTDFKICVCDFATATDYSEHPESFGETVDDVVRPKTNHVQSPEMVERRPRTISEDMWHIGCIFLAIVLVLKGKTEKDMFQVSVQEGEAPTNSHLLMLYRRKFSRERLGKWLDDLKSVGERSEAVEVVIDWVKDLLVSPVFKSRLSASD